MFMEHKARNIVAVDNLVILASAVVIIKIFYLLLIGGRRFIVEHEAVVMVIREHEAVARMLVAGQLVVHAMLVINVAYLLLINMGHCVILVPLLLLDLVVVGVTRH